MTELTLENRISIVEYRLQNATDTLAEVEVEKMDDIHPPKNGHIRSLFI